MNIQHKINTIRELKTKEICLKAINSYWCKLNHVPNEQKIQQFYLQNIKQNCETLRYIQIKKSCCEHSGKRSKKSMKGGKKSSKKTSKKSKVSKKSRK